MGFRDLSEDLIMEIFSLLPVKTLLRLRCVCKLWCALIKNPSFVSLHLSRASLRESDYLFVKLRSQGVRKNVISFHHSNIETLNDLSENIVVPFFDDTSAVHLLGPSNGVVCLYDSKWNHIALCNPATRRLRPLPIPSFTYPDHWIIGTDTDTVGFGFDPRTCDFKVIRVLDLVEVCSVAARLVSKTHVYNLSSNSWRQIEAHPGAFINQSPCTTALFNGAFHWHARLAEDSECIVSFHMSDEVFQKIPLPNILTRPYGNRNGRCSLGVLNQSLAFIYFEAALPFNGPVNKQFDIWIMKEYGVKDSWTRYCKIGPLPGVGLPLAFWKDSELLLQTRDGVLSCNLYHQNVKRFQIFEVPTPLEVIIYSESLFSIESQNCG